MSPELVTRVTALLTLLADVVLLTLVILAMGSRLWEPLQAGWRWLREQLGELALGTAWAVALAGTVLSLYFSEVAGFPPCSLCWYQRIALYPLVVLLGVALLRGDWEVHYYGVPLAVIGAAIAAYHALLQYGLVGEVGVCRADEPCTVVWVREFGFVTAPVMALSAFLLITALLVWLTPLSPAED